MKVDNAQHSRLNLHIPQVMLLLIHPKIVFSFFAEAYAMNYKVYKQAINPTSTKFNKKNPKPLIDR